MWIVSPLCAAAAAARTVANCLPGPTVSTRPRGSGQVATVPVPDGGSGAGVTAGGGATGEDGAVGRFGAVEVVGDVAETTGAGAAGPAAGSEPPQAVTATTKNNANRLDSTIGPAPATTTSAETITP